MRHDFSAGWRYRLMRSPPALYMPQRTDYTCHYAARPRAARSAHERVYGAPASRAPRAYARECAVIIRYHYRDTRYR